MRMVLALCLFATPVVAQSPQAALFPGDAGCFVRSYSTAHLAAHPDQLVKRIAVSAARHQPDPRYLEVQVAVTLRGSAERLQAQAYCENTGAMLSCAMEGDAGWLMLTTKAKGATLKVGREGAGFEGASGFVTLGGGHSDDEVFALARAQVKDCR